MSGNVVAESVLPGWTVALGRQIQDTCFQRRTPDYRQEKKWAMDDIYQANLTNCHLHLLEQFQVKANLVVPILVTDQLWGLLVAHQCSASRHWQPVELDLLDQLAVQIAIAIQQASAYEQLQAELLERQRTQQALQQLNQELEARVEQRTAALKESEERWQLALRGSNDGIWDWNLKTDEVFLSTRWKQMRGFAEHEINYNFEEWSQQIHPDDRDRVLQALADHLAQKTPLFREEYRFKCKDGSYIWVLDRGQALWDEAGKAIRMAGSRTDISEQQAALRDRKQAEEELIRNRDLREAIFNESTDALFLVDPRTLLTLNCNRQAVKLFEATNKEELIGIEGHTLQRRQFTPSEMASIVADIQSMASIVADIQSKGFWSRELEYVTCQGNSFWGNIAVKPITVAGHTLNFVRVSDISDRKQAEKILATYAHELADLYNNAPCGYHSIDIDGRFININDTELQWLGYTHTTLNCNGWGIPTQKYLANTLLTL